LDHSLKIYVFISIVILFSFVIFLFNSKDHAEALTNDITFDTRWEFSRKINASDIVNIHSGATLTIASHVTNEGVINVKPFGSLVIIFPGEMYQDGTLNISPGTLVTAGGTVVVGTPFFVGSNATINVSGLLAIELANNCFIMSKSSTMNVNFRGTLDVREHGCITFNSANFNTKSGGIANLKGVIGFEGTTNPSTVNIDSGSSINIAPSGTLSVENANMKVGGIINVNSGGLLVVAPMFIPSNPMMHVDSQGKVQLYGELRHGWFNGKGTILNSGTINKQCGGIYNYTIGNYSGNPIVDACFPITHMSDTTASTGLRISKGGNIIVGERITSASELKGDKIDQITLNLRKTGTPTGNATIGIFNGNGTLKKQFATMDVATTLTTAFKNHTFSLGNGELYEIVPEDRIGIKYDGGDSANFVHVMRDTNTADPFDGTNSHIQRFESGQWVGNNTFDMYMILKQTHG